MLEVFDAIFSSPEHTFLDHCVFLLNKSGGKFFIGKEEAKLEEQQAVAEQLRKLFTPSDMNDLERMKRQKHQRYDYTTYDFDAMVASSTVFFPAALSQDDAEAGGADRRRQKWAEEALEQLLVIASSRGLFNTKEAKEGETEATRMKKQMAAMEKKEQEQAVAMAAMQSKVAVMEQERNALQSQLAQV